MKAIYGTMITLLFAVVGCGTLSKGTLAVKEQVVGKYEFKGKEVTYGLVLIDDLTVKYTKNGQPLDGDERHHKWRVKGKEVLIEYPQRMSRTNIDTHLAFFRINADGSITSIAKLNGNIRNLTDGGNEAKRTDFIGEAQQEQRTYTKITEK